MYPAEVSRSALRAVRDAWPGLAAAGTAALAAQFMSNHYGAPAMLMALLLGVATNPLSEAPVSLPASLPGRGRCCDLASLCSACGSVGSLRPRWAPGSWR